MMADSTLPLNIKGFVISHLNIRSLLRHKDRAFHYLRLSDIICYSETWLSAKVDEPLLSSDGYKYFRQDRTYGTQGGGLIIYVEETLAPYVTVIQECCYTDKVGEELWVLINKPGRKKTLLGSIYRPPSGKIDNFNPHLNDTMTRLDAEFNLLQVDIVVLGDFNVNLAITQNPNRVHLNTTMSDHGLRQIVTHATQVTNKSSSLIDLVCTNMAPEVIYAAGVLNVSISDHMPIYISKKAQRKKHSKKVITSRLYGNYAKADLGLILFDNPKWRDFWNIKQDPDRLWLILCDIIQSSVDVLCPICKIVVIKS